MLISTFKEDQGRIEQGILNALEHLDQLEDEVEQRTGTAAVSARSEHADSIERNGRSASSARSDAPPAAADADASETADSAEEETTAPGPDLSLSIEETGTAPDSGSAVGDDAKSEADGEDEPELVGKTREAELDIF